jgi:hypothetical protein
MSRVKSVSEDVFYESRKPLGAVMIVCRLLYLYEWKEREQEAKTARNEKKFGALRRPT